MPFKKTRNSREDKSTNSSKKYGQGESNSSRPSSKSGYSDHKKTYGSSDRKTDRKPFEERGSGEFRKKTSDFKSTDNKGGYKTGGSDDYKKTGDRSFKPQKPASRFGGESSFKKKDYREKPAGERSFGQRKPTADGFKTNPERSRGGKGSYEQFRNNANKPKIARPKPAPQDENDFTFNDQPQRSFKSGSSEGRPYRKEFTPRPQREEREDRPARVVTPSDERADRMNANKNLRSRKNQKSPTEELIRLNRYIANAGICSRRKADELIAAGVVSVNGQVIAELGFKVNPSKDEVRYNGEALRREKMVYVLLNKPKDYITTTDDPHERRTVMQLVEKASRERIYPVGRLDRNTTGLLLMTNDGDLAEKLSHPRNNITKLYHAELNKSMVQGDLNKITYGLELEDGFIKPDVVSYVQGGSKREIGIQIHSGKNRIVRRIFEHLGYDVVKLDRVIYGGLTKKDLPRGKWRHLEEKEINILKNLI